RGDLWAGTAERGAFRYRRGRELGHFSFENSAGGLRSNLVYAVFADREGVVWFGTDRGVCRYDPRSAHAERVAVDPQSNFVHALFESAGGRLWCGANRGLFAREPGAAGWQPVEQLTGQAVHAIAEGEGGRLLVGASDGLYVSDAALTHTGQPILTRVERAADKLGSGDGVRAICRFRGATFIGSYGRGVERLGDAGLTPVWPLGAGAARERQVVSLYADGESRLWVGTAEAGVFVYDGRETRPAPGLEALRGSAVWAIAGTADTILWLATGRGLYRFQAGALAPALVGYDARGLAAGPSPESVWCATAGGGLFKVADGEEAGPLAARLDTEHGLPSDSVFAVHASRSPSGGEVIWVGTNRGVAAYEPGREPAVVRVVRVLGKRAYQPEEWHSGLRLEYPQNSLVVETAAASSRTFPEQFQYSFLLLDGAGRAVKRALSPDAQFVVEGLHPGRYRVEARAYTKDLTPSEPLGLAFEVAAAPFPVTTVALSTWLALALLALSWGYRQNRRLAGANRALAETRRQLATETEAERRRIARDLHDQTLADLRRLMLLADGPGNGAGLTPLFRADIESISTEIRRICEDLSPSVLENVGLTAALEWSLADAVAQLPEGRKFDYEFACGDGVEERLRLSPEVQIQIYRIVQEALSNVCRHAAPGHVRLAAEIAEDGAFVVTLADDGRDFDAGRKRAG
ncbi:MAG TPA: two-component regulator propeller domain-containing protein, partial [Blastocatellia bacterium]|nr:two-component regulator propeller domain-containing protein [Blastocatellia bacterium]